MDSLQIKSLIVLSEKENASREVNFTAGLNIILGENKTGKSSLIKSILFTLGCEVRFEEDWKKLIDYFLVRFEYMKENYTILRKHKEFSIYKEDSNSSVSLLLRTNIYHDYSNTIMQIFGVTMDCLTRDGKEISATPPLIFRYQYIDQDLGWSKIGEGFSNFKYITDWKPNSNKYIVGYQGEEFYKAKKEIAIINENLETLKQKLDNYEELMEVLNISLINTTQAFSISESSRNTSTNIAYSKLNNLNNLEREKLVVEEAISNLKSQRYEKYLQIEMLRKQVRELEEDHEFALLENETVKCPFCGVNHSNSIELRTEIIKDVQTGKELISIQRSEMNSIEEELNKLVEYRNKIFSQYKYYKKKAEEAKETASIINTYKDEGKNEIVMHSKREVERVRSEIDNEYSIRAQYEEQIKKLNSVNRRKEIRNSIITYLELAVNKLNIPVSYIKLNDFVQVLTKTGSDGPRIILAYYIALYLYNIERHSKVFEWMIIDTPNQQGQDEKNLNNINSVFSLLLDKGQVILGTERRTGYEELANNFIELTEKRHCLSKEKYQEHFNLIGILESMGK